VVPQPKPAVIDILAWALKNRKQILAEKPLFLLIWGEKCSFPIVGLG
jgi:hypothetical protein